MNKEFFDNQNIPEGLVFSSDDENGFTRRRAGKGFAFYNTDAKLINDSKIKERLKKLAIPPAYQDVWYCANENGHIQATGLDAKGRKQYRYHEKWSAWSNLQKFDSLLELSSVLPTIRRKVERGLKDNGLDKDRVLCAVVRLLDRTAARIGNEAYYQQNGSTGLTTLREKNIEVDGSYMRLSYVAKGGKEREFELYQPKLTEIVNDLQDLPGQRLFQYEGADNKVHPITSTDVNLWLKEVSGINISAKDFRTWHASQLCLDCFLSKPKPETQNLRVKLETEVLKLVSKELGHRPPVCKKHYIHPEILNLQRQGSLWDACNNIENIVASGLNNSEIKFVGFLKFIKTDTYLGKD